MNSRVMDSDRKLLLLQSPSQSSQFERLDAKTLTQGSVFRPTPNELQARQLGVNDTKMSDNEAFLAYTQQNDDDE
jgi:hypothetical protein